MHYIYKIQCSSTHRVYIGRTTNPSIRLSIHLRQLRSNVHHNIRLQREFNKYGEQSMAFECIWETESFECCCEMEELIIGDVSFTRLMNVSSASTGGDMLKNHPDRSAIIERRKATQAKQLEAMSAEERKIKWGRPGSANSMFGKTHSDHVKETLRVGLMARRAEDQSGVYGRLGLKNVERYGQDKADAISEKLSTLGRQRVGEANPFYGKSHTDEFKKISSARATTKQRSMSIEDRIMHPQTKILLYQNKLYIGASSLARSIGCTAGNISYMIKNNKCTIIEKEIALLIIQQRFSEVPVEMGDMEIVGYTTPYSKLEMGVAT